MNGEKAVKFTISVKKETAELIRQLVAYQNARKVLKGEDVEIITEEDFIRGAIGKAFNHIENIKRLSKVSSKEFIITNRFREILKQHRLKQKDLEEITGIGRATLSDILNNKTHVYCKIKVQTFAKEKCRVLHFIL